MLLQINIENFALIEKITVTFDKGFNILSGETGAGKSILIDAINYVLGGKSNKGFIRTGEERAFVEAIFTIENDRTEMELKKLDVEFEDIVIISRETFKSGKSITKVNGKSILVSMLKNISDTLIDIHGQHENQNLLDSNNHMQYLDNYGEESILNSKNKYALCYDKLLNIKSKIKSLIGKNGENEKLSDFLRYQIDEIEKAKLKIGEDEELEEKFSVISNSENISKIFSEAAEILYDGNENSKSIYDLEGYIINKLRSAQGKSEKIKKIADDLEETYYSIQQIAQDIKAIKDSVVYDEKELEYINSRLFQIDNYKKKYGKTIKDILDYKEKLQIQYDEFVNKEEVLKKLNLEKDKTYDELIQAAKVLHELRVKLAQELEVKVKEELNYVGLEKSTFKINIEFNEENISNSGADRVQFLISTNPGEPLKQLEKVVSGGELSRIMLAIKTVFVDKDKIPSVIFDEIDTGISGRIAQSVAEKMYVISKKHQVFCVTHLAQIACMSDVHFLVSKNTDNSKTYTTIKKLDSEGKKQVLALMIGGSEVTKLTIDHAAEMIAIADKRKKQILK
ncbi:DNA repair protein RecN [Clostridium hydrogenum]|uniref:DNA repair protein RecN n=1 Tax=Clostridium hydrogenum TaxID=2855764 RepID=UPI001EEE80B7|nr:DNA repair protein RecN [Clostridium hydrogenum]